jgi:hypothetical protein
VPRLCLGTHCREALPRLSAESCPRLPPRRAGGVSPLIEFAICILHFAIPSPVHVREAADGRLAARAAPAPHFTSHTAPVPLSRYSGRGDGGEGGVGKPTREYKVVPKQPSHGAFHVASRAGKRRFLRQPVLARSRRHSPHPASPRFAEPRAPATRLPTLGRFRPGNDLFPVLAQGRSPRFLDLVLRWTNVYDVTVIHASGLVISLLPAAGGNA